MTTIKVISRRGMIAANTELRSDMDLFFEANQNLWHKKKNPEGKFPLNMAENNLCWPLLQDKIEQILNEDKIPKWVANYTGLGGADSFLESAAAFMSKHIVGASIESQHLAASSGATAVLEISAWALCDSADVAIIPSPSYPVYTQDIKNKANVERYNLDVSKNTNGSISNEQLEKATKEINRNGKVLKLLILTSPDNPTGKIYNGVQLNKIANWCISNKIHLLVNELYSLSRINTKHKKIAMDYPKESPRYSFGKIILEKRSNYLHLAYGLSKDFGASGFRVGFIYSLNENFLQAYRNLNAPHMVSNITQWIFEKLLSDNKFIKKYKRKNEKRLTKTYLIVIEILKQLSIPYTPAKGSLFVWMDLSEFLKNNSIDEENILWNNIYDETGVLLTPGEGFGHDKRGQFRLVHSYLNPKSLQAAMSRLESYIIDRRRKHH